MTSGAVEIFALLILFAASTVLADQKACEKAREDCSKELKLNPSEVALVGADRLYTQRKFSELPKSVQCFSQCYHKKLNLLDTSNSLDLKAAKAALTEMFRGDYRLAETTLQTCKTEFTKVADDCVKSFNFEVCVAKD